MTHTESAVEALTQSTARIEAVVKPLPHSILVWRPAPQVWSILDNLAHIEEFVPFWICEIRGILANCPDPWGRDQSHAGRLAAVADTSACDPHELLHSIHAEVKRACDFLRGLSDAQLAMEARSVNPTWGVKPVSFLVDTLLVKHVGSHCTQIQRNLDQHRAQYPAQHHSPPHPHP